MKQIAHRLLLAHRKVDEEIRAEMRSPVPDYTRILRLKKRRLLFKDRVHKLSLVYRQEGA